MLAPYWGPRISGSDRQLVGIRQEAALKRVLVRGGKPFYSANLSQRVFQHGGGLLIDVQQEPGGKAFLHAPARICFAALYFAALCFAALSIEAGVAEVAS